MSYAPASTCFGSTASAADLLTASYAASTYGSAHRCSDFNQASFRFITSGTVTASIEWKIQFSEAKAPAASDWSDEMGTETSAGVVTHRELVRGIVDDTGAPTVALDQTAHVAIGSHRWLRIVAKRTGGDATSALWATVAFGVK